MTTESTGEYSGPETNETYEADSGSYDSFDDIGDDTYAEVEQQGTTSHTKEDDEETDSDPTPKYKRQANGSKSDDMKVLDTIEGEQDSEEEEVKEEEKPEVKPETKPEEVKEEEKKDDKPKGKKVYVKLGEETFAIDSQATIPHKVNGKLEHIPVQELLNNYAGKVGYDSKFNELNLKEQNLRKTEAQIAEKNQRQQQALNEIMEVVNNKEADPFEALYKLVDMAGGDRYDFYERAFRSQLVELHNVLEMSPVERKAYLLEKKNEYLQQQSEKRKQADTQVQKVNTYRQQVDALRKSYGVSEAQYVDALDELKSMGNEDKDLDEQTIVEWASLKPHKAEVENLLTPYLDQISDSVYGEVVYKLSSLLREGTESAQSIQKHLQDVYGLPTEVQELSKKLTPVGRPKTPPTKPASTKPNNKHYDSFDDFEEEY